MKTMKKTIAAALLVFASLLTGSCTKTGPAGPQGSAGVNGNANVKTYNFYNQGFAYVSANSDYECNLSVPDITQAVLDKGAIMAYMQPTSVTTAWVQLPCTVNGISFDVANYVGTVQIVLPNASSGLFNFKVVVIPQ